MADNIQLALNATGQTVSTEDNGSGIQLPRSKIMLGAAHVDGGDVSVANPFPVSVGQNVTQAYNGLVALTPLYAAISAASSGDNTLVALVSLKQIVVLKWSLWASGGAVNFKFMDGGGANLTGVINLLANQPASGAYCPVGHFATASGTLLKINLSGAVQVSGYLCYVTV